MISYDYETMSREQREENREGLFREQSAESREQRVESGE